MTVLSAQHFLENILKIVGVGNPASSARLAQVLVSKEHHLLQCAQLQSWSSRGDWEFSFSRIRKTPSQKFIVLFMLKSQLRLVPRGKRQLEGGGRSLSGSPSPLLKLQYYISQLGKGKALAVWILKNYRGRFVAPKSEQKVK